MFGHSYFGSSFYGTPYFGGAGGGGGPPPEPEPEPEVQTPSGVCILYDDRIPAAVLSTSGAISSLPVSNLQDPQPRQIAGWTGSIATIFVDFLTATEIGAVVAAVTNLGSTAVRRVRTSDSDPTCLSGVTHDSASAAAGADSRYNGTFSYILEEPVTARYLRLDVSQDGLSEVFIGLLLAGPTLRPIKNFDWGWGGGWRDAALQDQSPAGLIHTSRRVKHRVLELTFRAASESEAWGDVSFFEMGRIAGLSENIAVIPKPSGTYRAAQTIVGPLIDLNRSDQPHRTEFTHTLSVMERP